VETSLLWPPAVIRQIATAFSEHRARVGLLSWPDTGPDQQAAALDDRADAALAVLDKLGRTGILEHLPEPADTPTAAARPFQVPLPPASGTGDPGAPPAHAASGPIGDLELIITSLPPSAAEHASSDCVALHAARRLKTGGILTVLTHSQHSDGALIDPTGTVVTAAQNADLLYLQHLVVLHTPLHRKPFSPTTAPDGARVHRRTHSDLLVFAQPHGHEPPR